MHSNTACFPAYSHQITDTQTTVKLNFSNYCKSVWRPRSSHMRRCLNRAFVAHFIWHIKMQKAPFLRRSWIERTHIFVVHHPHLVWADKRVQETNKRGNETSCDMLYTEVFSSSVICWWLSVQLGSWPIKKKKKKGGWHWFWSSDTIKIICRSLQVVSSARI